MTDDIEQPISEIYVLAEEILPLLIADKTLLEAYCVQYFILNHEKQALTPFRFYNLKDIEKEISHIKEVLSYEKGSERRALELASMFFFYFTAHKSPYDVERPLGWEKWFEGRYRTYFHTDEAKKKISESQKGRKRSAETKAKISNALKGRKLSAEHCKKNV